MIGVDAMPAIAMAAIVTAGSMPRTTPTAATASVASIAATVPPARIRPTIADRSTARLTTTSEAESMWPSSRPAPRAAMIPCAAPTVSAIRVAMRPRARRRLRDLWYAVRAQGTMTAASTPSGNRNPMPRNGSMTVRPTTEPTISGMPAASGPTPCDTQLRTLERSLVVRATVMPRWVRLPGVSSARTRSRRTSRT